MGISWQEVPSDTIKVSTKGAIEIVEPVPESLTLDKPDEAVRLYVIFMESDTATLEQQVEALAKTVDMSVRLYDHSGHAAVIQTTAKYIPIIENTSEVAEVRREYEAELTGSKTTDSVSIATDIPEQTVSNLFPTDVDTDKSTFSESAEAGAVNETDAAVPTEASEEADTESEETTVITQTVQIAENDSENDAQDINPKVNEQTTQLTQTAEVIATPAPIKKGSAGTTITFAVLGCIIIFVAAFLIIRRR